MLDFMGHGASLWTSAGPVRICEGWLTSGNSSFLLCPCFAKRSGLFPDLERYMRSDGHFVSDGHLDMATSYRMAT